MRLARIRVDGTVRYAELEAEEAYILTGSPFNRGTRTGELVRLDETELRCPIEPSKILCIGRNYVAHIRELGHEIPKEPVLFLKPPSSLIGHGDAIVLPPESARVDHEAELGVVFGKRARNVRAEEALDYVYGYTAVGDITARDLQPKDGQWARAKGFDTFCPVGPWVTTGLDPARLRVQARVNGATRQDGETALMMCDVPALIAYASRVMTFEPGDLLVTGTPEGVGRLDAGDVLEIEVRGKDDGDPGVGVLRVGVRAAG